MTSRPGTEAVGPPGPRRVRPGLLAASLATTLLAAGACGHSSGPTSPDQVSTADRATHLTAQKQRVDDPPRLTPMTVADVVALPTFPRAYSVAQLAEISALEERGVTVTGFLARLLRMDDGDYHVQITEAPPGQCVGSDHTDQLITELTPGVRARRPAYTFDALQALCGADTSIRVSGWLLYDSPHKGDSGRSTPWEVHPVTRIEVCCWRELS